MLEQIIAQTKFFFEEDMDIEIINFETIVPDYESLKLRDFTAILGIGWKINLMAVISLDVKLLNKLVSKFMDGEEVSSRELEVVQESVAGEIINTVIGLSLHKFPYKGKGITITPPVSINEISILKKNKHSKITSTKFITKFGDMCVGIITEK